MNKPVLPKETRNFAEAMTVDQLLRRTGPVLTYRALEPRMAFDGAAVATVAAAADHQAGDVPAAQRAVGPEASVAGKAGYADRDSIDAGVVPDKAALSAPADFAMNTTGQNDGGKTIVFIDQGIQNLSDIVRDIDPTFEIVLISDDTSGIHQIAVQLNGRTDISSIHIISHGASGTLFLGNEALNSSNLADHAADLEAIGKALSSNGDILIYGCNVADGTRGQHFLDSIAHMTNADVAGSLDLTGAAALGGNWVLESSFGSVEARTITAADFGGTLAPIAIAVTPDSLTVRNGAGTVVTTGATGYTSGRSVAVGQGGTATWTNVGSVGGRNVDLVATVVSITTGDTVFFDRPTAANNDPGFLLNDPNANGADARIRWDLVISGTTTAIQADVSFSVADVDGVGGNPNTREVLRVDTNTLTSFTTAGTTDIRVDTGTAGVITASGTQNEIANPPTSISAIRFDWTNTSSFEITYSLIAGAGTTQAGFSHDGNNQFVFAQPNLTSIPRLDLDANDSSGVTGSGYQNTFTEDSTSVAIVDADVRVQNPIGNVESAVVTLRNAQNGDQLNIGILPAGITAVTDTSVSGVVRITLTGARTAADYQNALNAITFRNTIQNPSSVDRQIDIFFRNATFTSNVATSTIHVIAVDDAPVNTLPGRYTANEDTSVALTGLSIADIDAGTSNVTVTLNVSSGTIALTTTPLVTVTGSGTGTLRLTGTVASINALLASSAPSYSPAANFNGSVTLTMTTNDNGNTGVGGPLTDVDQALITINPVNDSPGNTVPASVTTAEDTPVRIVGIAVSDADGSDVILTTTLTIPAGTGILNLASITGVTVSGDGSASITLTGTAAAINAATAAVTFTPVADYNGPANLAIATTDGIVTTNSTLAITVTPVADTVNDAVTTNEDTRVTFNPLANDNFENPRAAITSVTNGANGTVTLNADGTVTYTPNANFNGTDTFTYTVTSGGVTETATVTVTVTAVNDAPVNTVPGAQVTTEDTARIITGISVADVDGGTLTTTLTIPAGSGAITVGSASGATVTGNGSGTVTISGTAAAISAAIASVTYTPTPDFNAPAGIALTVATSDGTVTTTGRVSITVTPVADTTNDAVTTAEDTARTFNVLTGTLGATADNFENAGAAVTSVTQPANGAVTFAADGTITYTPSANFNGTDTFTYTVTSGGVTETATVTVTVTAVNDASVLTVPGAQTVPEDTNIVFNSANGNAIIIADVDSNVTATLTVANGILNLGSTSGVTVTGNGTGTVTVSGNPAAVTAALNGLTFVPLADWNGTTTLNVSTSDGVAPAVSNAISITETPVVDIAPNAVTTNEDTASTFNVLTNDTFENPGRLVSSVTQPANGTVTFNANGTVTYTPRANYNGTDSFTYTVTSGGVTETTTVSLTVNPVNDAPTGLTPFPRTSIDGAPGSYAVAGFFSDVDGDVLTFSAAGLPTGLSINPATGQISGTIDQHASQNAPGGVFSVSVTATDPSGASVTRTFNWTVTNPAPVAASDAFTGNEDTAITGNVRTNDSDPDGDALTVDTQPVSGPANGTLTLNSNGTFTYTPFSNFNGTDTFTYTLRDADGATTTATVTLYVNPVNDSPANVVPGNQSTPEDRPLVFSSANGNAISVTDVDSPSITTTLAVGRGTLTLGSTAGVTVTGDGTGSVTITGSPADITAAINGLRYANNPDYNGSDTLTMTSSDGIATTTARLALNITPVADIAADAVTTSEEAGISFNVLTGTNGATPDTFEGSPAISGFTQPANGYVSITPSGTALYVPNPDFNGTDTFTYTVTSGGVTETTTVTVTVTPVNDAPTQTVPGAQSGTEDTSLTFSGANGNQIVVRDIDGGSVTTTVSVPSGRLTAITTPGVTITGNGTGAITLSGSPAAITAALNGLAYTPVADANGSVPLTVTTSDGDALPVSNTISIDLAPVADITNDTVSTAEDTARVIAILANDSFENPAAAVASVTNGAHGTVTINANGTVTYTPDPNYNGTDSFTYTVTSGGVTETATVTVVVNPVNDTPVNTVPAAQTTAEDTNLTFSGATGNAIRVADVDGDTLTTTLAVTNGTIDLGSVVGVTISGNGTGTVVITGSPAAVNAALDGLIYRPTADYNGAAVLTVTTTDGTATDSDAINIRVTPVADIVADVATTNEDQAVVINVLANDNFENSGATVTGVTQALHGTVTIGSGGNVTYTPDANYNGPDSFTYTVTSGGVTETATVTLSVLPVNDPPVTAIPGSQTTNEDSPVVFSNANGNAIQVSDIDGDIVTVTLSGANGTLTLGTLSGVTVTGNGSGLITVRGSAAAVTGALNGLSFAPTADYNGAAAITVTTTDGTVTTSNSIDITVTPVADIVANTAATNEDTPVTINVLANDTFENPARAITSVTQGASGTVSFSAGGTVIYTPDPNFFGTDTFTYTVTSGGVIETTTVTVTVNSINDAPTTTGLGNRSNLDGQAVSLNVAPSFADVDGDALTFTATGLPTGLSIDPATGLITGTIDQNASQGGNGGVYTIVVTASDGRGGTVSTAFTWSVANPPPVANNDGPVAATEDTPQTIDVLANDTDPDNDPLSVVSATAGNGTVTINPDGTIRYTPAANFNGTDTIVYRISDGNGGFSTATVTVNVAPVNDAPIASGLGNLVDVDNQAVSIDVSSAFADIDGDTLTYTIAGLPPGLTFDPATGIISGTIANNASAPSGNQGYPITVTASDGHGGTVQSTFTWTIINIPPTALDDAVTTPEDTPVVVSILANDQDPDNDPLTITEINGQPITLNGPPIATAHGQVQLILDAQGNQVLRFTPNPNFNGVESLVYRTSDGGSGFDTATLTITVAPVNDAPTADPLPNLSSSDSDVVSVGVGSFFNDVDQPDGDTLTFSAENLPPGLSINPATGEITGTIDRAASQHSPYTIVITAVDSEGGTVRQSFTWTVENPAPVAISDARTLAEGDDASADAATGVLANDADPDGDPKTVSAVNGSPLRVGEPVQGSAGGMFTINPDGSYTFSQNGAFEDLQTGESRTTTITYTLSDGNGGFSIATLSITVNGVNDAPVASSLPNQVTVDNAPLTLNAASAFSDVEGDTLTFLVDPAHPLPAGLSINPATGVISGTIDRSASQGGTGGVYTVTINANDGHGGITPVSFTITVTNPPPVAGADVASATEDTPVNGNVLTNDSDPDGDTIRVTAFTIAGVPGTFNPGATVTIPGVGTITIDQFGAYTFDPAANYHGPVPVITYTIADRDGATDTATLTIGPVRSVNDDPVSAPIAGQSSNDSAPIALNVSSNFTDVDGTPLTFSAAGLPPGLLIDPDTGLITGTIDHLASQNGPYSVTVTATDPDGRTTSQTFTWAVTNPAPVASTIPDAASTDSNTVSIATRSAFNDPDGDTLTFSANGLPAGLSINPATGVISGTLGKDASAGGPLSDGVYTITITATDSQGAAVFSTFTYTVVNPAPTAGHDFFNGNEDTNISGSVTANDQDPDGDAVTYAVASGPAHGTLIFNPNGTFTYTPAPNYNGTDTFTYRIIDAQGEEATATVTLTIAPVNDVPGPTTAAITTSEDTPLTGTLPATDVDGDIVAFAVNTRPAHGTLTLAPDGTYTYTPDPNYHGPDSFVVALSDGNGGTTLQTVSVTVTPVNDPPVAANATATVAEDTPFNGTLPVSRDVDGDAVTYSTASDPAHGTLMLNADGTYTYVPDLDYNGSDTFTYTVSDGRGGTNTYTVAIQVGGTNDAPTAANQNVSVPEDRPLIASLPSATDIDGDPVTYSKTSEPAHGTLVVNPDGTYVYTPFQDFHGPDSFTYTISDGFGGTNTYTVVINVISVNDNPVAVDDSRSGDEDRPILGNVIPLRPGQDSDPDGDSLTVDTTPVTGPSHGTLVLNADGTFIYTPAANYTGTDSFVYRVSDGNGGFAEATVHLTITPVNDPPIADNASITTNEDAPFSGRLPGATDADGDPVTYAKASEPAHGTLVVNADGTYVYRPNPDYNGPDSFTFTVSDGNGGIITRTVTILVTPVNDPPVARPETATVNSGSSVNVAVLSNDTDADGDQLSVVNATASNGTVQVLADGTIRYTPRPGFFGTDTVTYVISDGHGGYAIASITIDVRDNSYTERPQVFGFNGPERQLPPQTPSYFFEGITVDGAVVNAVFDIGQLGSIANEFNASGVVVAAANGPRSLGSIGALGTESVITGTIEYERMRSLERFAGFERSRDLVSIDGLPGFSLRRDVPGNLGGLSSQEQVVIESLVRGRTLIVQVSNTVMDGARKIVDYRFSQSNGQPLPEWLDRAGRDLLIGERAANSETLKIRVEAVYDDGKVVVQEVKIDTATGEIQPLKNGKQGLFMPKLFQEQFRVQPILSADEVQNLGRALAR